MARVTLGHGSGGELTRRLIHDVFLKHLPDPELGRLGDAAVLPREGLPGGGSLAFTTDSYVITPLEFPGGDIGHLAVCGTVNDLAAAGARPLWLTAGWILEEGLPLDLLERQVASLAATAEAAGVRVVAGDTKVVPHGLADGLYINTAGLGWVPPGRLLRRESVQPGDAILVSGTLGDHGMAVMLARQGMRLQTNLVSDAAPLNELVERLFAAGVPVHWLRDATRGGLGGVLCELAETRPYGVRVEATALPVRPEVEAAAELLGLDPLFVANEGKMVAVVPGDQAEAALTAWRAHPHGTQAAQVGVITEERPGQVLLRTAYGGARVLRLPAGELLPRIC